MTRTPRFLLACLFLFFAAALYVQSQASAGPNASPATSPVAITFGESSVALNGPWKFSVGDSPVDPKTGRPLWAEPEFDDSKWETVDLTPKEGAVDPTAGTSAYVPGWTARGHAGYSGYGWYRIRVQYQLQPGQRLALAGPADVDDAYQVFADGELLGSLGNFSGSQPAVYLARPMVFRLREPRGEDTGTRVLAFRVWMLPASLVIQPTSGGMHNAPVLGEASIVALQSHLKWMEIIRVILSQAILALAFGVLALVAFSLILFDRSDPVYLWIGLLFLSSALGLGLIPIGYWPNLLPANSWLLLAAVLGPVVSALWVIVWWIWFGRTAGRWIPWALCVLVPLDFISRVLSWEVLFGVVSQQTALRFGDMERLLTIVFFVLLLWVVVDAIRRHRMEGWLVLPVVILHGVSSNSRVASQPSIRLTWFPFGIPVPLEDVEHLLIALVIALLLLRRLIQSVKCQKEMALDVKSAQEVQKVILPEQRIVLPGFEIESEYRPAREVGGDFFQIIPNDKDGSLLIVAGDVAGKGLRAGMLVALLIGAIRTAARFSSDPVFVLSELNRRLLGRGDARATCLALRIDRDGTATLANAGHLPPYLNSAPVEIEGSLPLGLIEAFEPSVLQFQFSPGDRLLLLSDGIAEATNKQGQLFGFDRVLELVRTQPSAAKIAEAAQAFGQDDDISVIALTRIGTAEPAMA
jgi:Stage II sporulation protein E (SpoIIE)